MKTAHGISIVNLIIKDGYGVIIIRDNDIASSEILKSEDIEMLKNIRYGVPYEFSVGNLDVVSNDRVTLTISKYVAELDEVTYVEHTFSKKAFEAFIANI